ncbi:MAG TPA: HEPN domain-containing protein [Anaerolineae bacterium]|nr:HEPN domain-containing protein [Anaerolineae bacterium]
MDKDQLKRQEIEDLYELAVDYLEAARASLSEERYRIATDLAYNAAELSAKGLLFLLLDDLPSTHKGEQTSLENCTSKADGCPGS